jgi:hypothetical protein
MCQSISDCNHHGDCFYSTCYCDAGWFDYTCTRNLKDYYREAYYVFIGVYLAAFAFIGIVSFRQLLISLEEKKGNT